MTGLNYAALLEIAKAEICAECDLMFPKTEYWDRIRAEREQGMVMRRYKEFTQP